MVVQFAFIRLFDANASVAKADRAATDDACGNQLAFIIKFAPFANRAACADDATSLREGS